MHKVRMKKEDLKDRTKEFATKILGIIDLLPSTIKGRIISNQIGRSGTSVGANYRAACRARSKAEFISKLGIVIEEADESAYWLELITENKILRNEATSFLLDEAEQLVAIMTASRKTAETSLAREKLEKKKNRQSQIGNHK